jgi:uncharacterized coiled-coil DUF342 family protein
MYNQEPLSNEQLRQLIESNARAIQGNSESIAELRQQVSGNSAAIGELRQEIAETNQIVRELRQEIAETNQIVREGFQAVQADMQQLARFMSQFFQGQASHNGIVDGALEDHERRLNQLEIETGE